MRVGILGGLREEGPNIDFVEVNDVAQSGRYWLQLGCRNGVNGSSDHTQPHAEPVPGKWALPQDRIGKVQCCLASPSSLSSTMLSSRRRFQPPPPALKPKPSRPPHASELVSLVKSAKGGPGKPEAARPSNAVVDVA